MRESEFRVQFPDKHFQRNNVCVCRYTRYEVSCS